MQSRPQNINDLFELVSEKMTSDDLDEVGTYFAVNDQRRPDLNKKDDKGRTLLHYIAINAPNEIFTRMFIQDMYQLREINNLETGKPVLIDLFARDKDGYTVVDLAAGNGNKEFLQGVSEIEAPRNATQAYKTAIEDIRLRTIQESKNASVALTSPIPIIELEADAQPEAENTWEKIRDADFEMYAEESVDDKIDKAAELLAMANDHMSDADVVEIEQFYVYDFGSDNTDLLFDEDSDDKTIIHYLAEYAPDSDITAVAIENIINNISANTRERMLDLILSPDNPSLAVIPIANLNKNSKFLDGLKRSLENMKNDKNLKTHVKEKIEMALAALAPEVKKLNAKDMIKNMGDIWHYLKNNNLKSDPQYSDKVINFFERFPFLINTANMQDNTVLHILANNAKVADANNQVIEPHAALIANLIKRFGADPAKFNAAGQNAADIVKGNDIVAQDMIKALTSYDASSKTPASDPNKLDVDRALNAVLGLSKELEKPGFVKPEANITGKTSNTALDDFKALAKAYEIPNKKPDVPYKIAVIAVKDMANDLTHDKRNEAMKALVDHYLALAKANVGTKKGVNEPGRKLAREAFIELLNIKASDHDEASYIKAKQQEACQFLNKHHVFTKEQGLGGLLKSASAEVGVKLKTSLLSAFFKEKPDKSQDKPEQSQEKISEHSRKI